MMKKLFSIDKKALSPPLYTRYETKFDLIYFALVSILALFGTLMVFSAGGPYAYARYGDSAYFVKKQALWLLFGILTMLFASRIKPEFIKAITPILYLITIFLLILVLITGFVGNGAKRWISIGPFTIQPSEFAKFTLILIMARYFSDNDKTRETRSKRTVFIHSTLYPVILMLLPIILVMLQKHLSCIIILGLLGLLMIVSSGAALRYIKAACLLGGAGIFSLAVFTDYTKDRITVWQNPEAYKLTGGWQTLQGLMAIGSGGLFGTGYGKSILKHCYVSEPANDMIFAILCEELGLFGALLSVLLFSMLVIRGVKIALRTTDTYTRLLALGISVKMATQVLLNIAVVTNTIPNTGISLPFFSYGGSSLIMLFFEMGIMLSISRCARIQK